MVKKNKDFMPKDMNDLEEMFYGPNRDDANVDIVRQRRYFDWYRTVDRSPSFEDAAEKFFVPLGKLEKIPETPSPHQF